MKFKQACCWQPLINHGHDTGSKHAAFKPLHICTKSHTFCTYSVSVNGTLGEGFMKEIQGFYERNYVC